MRYSLLTFILLGLVIAGCKDDPVSPEPVQPPPLVNAVYVLNEGDFGDATGARLTVHDLDNDLTYRDVFEAANGGQHLGSLGDDIKIYNGKAYILMSASERINVIDLANQQLLQSGDYPGDSPKDMVIDSVNGKIYTSLLYKNSVLVINLTTLAIIDSIAVGNNPQALLLNGSDLFVCNTGFGSDNTVSVIDVQGDTVRTTLILSDGPASAMLASDGNIWIACTGNAFGVPATLGKIFAVDASTLAIEDSITFSENLWGSLSQGIDDFAYVVGVNSSSFFGGPIHRIAVPTKTVTSNFLAAEVYYSMSIDPVSGDLFLADAKNFAASGVVSIFDKNGVFKRNFTAQKGPRGNGVQTLIRIHA